MVVGTHLCHVGDTVIVDDTVWLCMALCVALGTLCVVVGGAVCGCRRNCGCGGHCVAVRDSVWVTACVVGDSVYVGDSMYCCG